MKKTLALAVLTCIGAMGISADAWAYSRSNTGFQHFGQQQQQFQRQMPINQRNVYRGVPVQGRYGVPAQSSGVRMGNPYYSGIPTNTRNFGGNFGQPQMIQTPHGVVYPGQGIYTGPHMQQQQFGQPYIIQQPVQPVTRIRSTTFPGGGQVIYQEQQQMFGW
jgi:hypothetical protein